MSSFGGIVDSRRLLRSVVLESSAKKEIKIGRFDIRVCRQANFAGRQGPCEPRCHQNYQFGLAFLVILTPEQRTENGYRAQARELRHLACDRVAQQASKTHRLPVAQFTDAGGAAFADRANREPA